MHDLKFWHMINIEKLITPRYFVGPIFSPSLQVFFMYCEDLIFIIHLHIKFHSEVKTCNCFKNHIYAVELHLTTAFVSGTTTTRYYEKYHGYF